MANLSKIIKISKTDYDTLAGGTPITKDGVTYNYDANAVYLVTPTAVGSSTRPIYINNSGEFVAGSQLATVATTGSYNDLSNKPTIPEDVSDLNNDAGYMTDGDVDAYADNNLIYRDFGEFYNRITLYPDESGYCEHGFWFVTMIF